MSDSNQPGDSSQQDWLKEQQIADTWLTNIQRLTHDNLPVPRIGVRIFCASEIRVNVFTVSADDRRATMNEKQAKGNSITDVLVV